MAVIIQGGIVLSASFGIPRAIGSPAHIALCVVALVLALTLAPAAGAKDSPGNNGTVKVHDGDAESERVTQNEPKVGCSFHLHFMFGDDQQTGFWEIRSAPPTGDGSVVAAGPYDTMGDGEARYPEAGTSSLPSGHYKLSWGGDAGKNDKYKTFWVDCEGGTQPPT